MAAKKRVDVSAAPERSNLKHNPFAALPRAAPAAPPSTPPDATEAVVSAPPASAAPHTPSAPCFDRKLVIRREHKGRGGKTVTRIAGLPSQDRQALAALMKKKLGCGGLVEGEDVLLLGDLVDRAADWLQAQGATRIVKGN